MRVLLVLVVSLTCLFAAVGVRAQSAESRDARIAEAKKAFSIGTQAYADGEFDTALASFRHAYELTGSPDLLFNVATVSDRMRRDEEALEAYEAYLQARPDSADREHVEGRIEVLRAAIEERRRAEIEADIEARKAAVEAAGSRARFEMWVPRSRNHGVRSSSVTALSPSTRTETFAIGPSTTCTAAPGAVRSSNCSA